MSLRKNNFNTVSLAESNRDTDFRIRLTTSCRDSDVIPKVVNAGKSVIENGEMVQIMHNGLRVLHGGYHGDWMAKVIEGLEGHHEPQEELVFDAILKKIGPQSTMIELGCFWSYYSLWFLKGFPFRRALGVEPDPAHITVGMRNARINGLNLTIQHGYIASNKEPLAAFETETSGPLDVPALSPASLMKDFTNGGVLDILHCDTQGAEVHTLLDCEELFRSRKIKFVVVSTHALEITGSALTHQTCLHLLKDYGGKILVEHDVHESFSGDGLIAAYFGEEEIDLSEIQISRNSYSNALFLNPIFQLERFLLQEANQNAEAVSDTDLTNDRPRKTTLPIENLQTEAVRPQKMRKKRLRINQQKLFSIPVIGFALHFLYALSRLPKNDKRVKPIFPK